MTTASTTVALLCDSRGWWGECSHDADGIGFSMSRGYFATLDELDRVMRAELKPRPAELLEKWCEVVARQKADA